MTRFRIPFRRHPVPAPQTDAQRVTAYLGAHPDSSSRDISDGIPMPWSRTSTALATLEAAGRVDAHWTWGPAPRQRLYRLTGTGPVPKPPQPARAELTQAERLDTVALTLLHRVGRTAGDITTILGLDYATVFGALRELEAAGRVTCHDDGGGILRWRLVARTPAGPDTTGQHPAPPATPAPRTAWRAQAHP